MRNPAILLALALLAGGCAANQRSIVIAAGGQLAGTAAYVHCARIVQQDPSQAQPLLAMANAAQAELDKGSPLVALAQLAMRPLSPQSRAELAAAASLLDTEMAGILAKVQGAVNGCRLAVVAETGGKSPTP